MAIRHLRQPPPARSRAGLVLIAAVIGLGGCLEEAPAAEPYVSPRLSAEALADSVNAILAVVYSPHSADWYDTVLPAVAPVRNAHQEQDAASSLLAALEDDNPVVRRHAAFILGELAQRRWTEQPHDIASALTAAVADSDARTREVAARSVANALTDRETEALLIPVSRDPDARVRWAAVVALSYWGHTNAADARLLEAFDDPDPRVRYAAAFGLQSALPASHARSEAIIGQLIARMAVQDSADIRVAAHQLELSGLHLGEQHLQALVALARSTDPVVRRQAASQISGNLLQQHRESTLDRDLLAVLIGVNRADLAHDHAWVRASAAWSLRGIRAIDRSSLAEVDAALAAENDLEARRALRVAQGSLNGDSRVGPHDPEWTYADDLCVPHDAFAIMGLRPWDDDFKIVETLGEPARIAGGMSEDDGGQHIVLGYEYGTLDVEIARFAAQRIATRATTVPTDGGLRVGQSRQEALALLGVVPNARNLAARHYVIHECDGFDETYLNLEFGEDGRIAAIAIEGYGP